MTDIKSEEYLENNFGATAVFPTKGDGQIKIQYKFKYCIGQIPNPCRNYYLIAKDPKIVMIKFP